MDWKWLDERPIIVAVTGSNGAGKTTFFEAHLSPARMRFINADFLAKELDIEPYAAAELAKAIRLELVKEKESFIFETVFSDPVGDEVQFLKDAVAEGYSVVVCFIGLASHELSEQRVTMRVSKGGHDVPSEKLIDRFPRTLENLKSAISLLPRVLVFDNSNMADPFKLIASFDDGRLIYANDPLPEWFSEMR